MFFLETRLIESVYPFAISDETEADPLTWFFINRADAEACVSVWAYMQSRPKQDKHGFSDEYLDQSIEQSFYSQFE